MGTFNNTLDLTTKVFLAAFVLLSAIVQFNAASDVDPSTWGVEGDICGIYNRCVNGLACLRLGEEGYRYCLDVDNKCFDQVKGIHKSCEAGYTCKSVAAYWPIGYCVVA